MEPLTTWLFFKNLSLKSSPVLLGTAKSLYIFLQVLLPVKIFVQRRTDRVHHHADYHTRASTAAGVTL